MASVPLPILLPPPGPSAARRRPPVVPRALYQIINKAAGAVCVNILVGLEGHCRGGLPTVASKWPSRAGHPHSGSSGTAGLSQPPPFGADSAPTEVCWEEGRGTWVLQTHSQGHLASGLLSARRGPLGVRTWSLAIFLCAVHTPRTARPIHGLAVKQISEESCRPLPTVHSGMWRPKGLVLMVVMEQRFFAEKCPLVT